MTMKTLMTLYQLFVLVFILPALVFWVIFACSGYDLGGFFSIFGFFIDGYRAATVHDREVFVRGIYLFSIVYSIFITFILYIIKQGREESYGTNA